MNSFLTRLVLISLLSVQTASSDTAVQTLQPSQVHEVCMVLTPPEHLEYAFTANAGLHFNIHYHRGGEIVYPVPEQLIARKQGLFRATVSQKYCLMWTNPTARPVELELKYTRRSTSD